MGSAKLDCKHHEVTEFVQVRCMNGYEFFQLRCGVGSASHRETAQEHPQLDKVHRSLSKLADSLRARELYVPDPDEEEVSDVAYDEQDKDDDKLYPSDDYINSDEKKTQDGRLENYLDNDIADSPEACYDMLAQTLHDVYT